jgi:hypothetical protein
MKFEVPAKPAGCWIVGANARLYVRKRPTWLHRKMAALLLGWKWENA